MIWYQKLYKIKLVILSIIDYKRMERIKIGYHKEKYFLYKKNQLKCIEWLYAVSYISCFKNQS